MRARAALLSTFLVCTLCGCAASDRMFRAVPLIFAAYRNLVRRRFSREEEPPAQMLGSTRRRLRAGELLGWRQDWGRRSLAIGGAARAMRRVA